MVSDIVKFSTHFYFYLNINQYFLFKNLYTITYLIIKYMALFLVLFWVFVFFCYFPELFHHSNKTGCKSIVVITLFEYYYVKSEVGILIIHLVLKITDYSFCSDGKILMSDRNIMIWHMKACRNLPFIC